MYNAQQSIGGQFFGGGKRGETLNEEGSASGAASGSGLPEAAAKAFAVRWLLFRRVAWTGLAIILLGTSFAAFPIAFQRAHTICQSPDCLTFNVVVINQPTPEEALILQQFGLSIGHYAIYQVAFVLLPCLLSFVVSVLLIWRPSQDRMAWFMAFAFLLWSWFFPPDITYQVVAPSWHRVIDIFLLAPYYVAWQLMFFLFPDGRFAPRWVAPVALGRVGLIVAGLLFPESILDENTWPMWVGVAVNVPVICLGLYCQFYKYRHGAPQRRRQTRWVVFGLSAVLMPGFLFLGLLSLPTFTQPGLPRLLAYPPFALVVAGVYLSFAVSILRHHLWDINIIVNRALVYGSLTTIVVGIYIVVVGALSTLLHVHGSLFVSLVGTGVAALLLLPLRERLQRAANRLIYGERDDPHAVLSRLGQRLEETLTPDMLLSAVVETVAQALRLPYVALTLKEGAQFKTTAEYNAGHNTGQSSIADKAGALTLPLVHQTETIGQLIVAPRAPGEEFDLADHRLLVDIAHQAGMAAQAARLAADLQHSRERLVTSREEERRRLRRDLHDGLGPTLASHSLQLEEAMELLVGDPANGVTSDPVAAAALLRDLKTQTQMMVADIRRLIYQLRPPTLDELGLLGALRIQAAQLTRTNNGLHIVVEATPTPLPPLPAAIEVAAYCIVLEALTNVVRHAQARMCCVHLSFFAGRPETLEVTIIDDGLGLPSQLQAGVGLISMRERAEELGGVYQIESTPTGGVRVLARLPFVSLEAS
jgi:signal transduction histidine kinase